MMALRVGNIVVMMMVHRVLHDFMLLIIIILLHNKCLIIRSTCRSMDLNFNFTVRSAEGGRLGTLPYTCLAMSHFLSMMVQMLSCTEIILPVFESRVDLTLNGVQIKF